MIVEDIREQTYSCEYHCGGTVAVKAVTFMHDEEQQIVICRLYDANNNLLADSAFFWCTGDLYNCPFAYQIPE